MKQGIFKQNFFGAFIKSIFPVLFTVMVIFIVSLSINQAEEASREEGVRLLEEALNRAAAHSFAVNGYFPESLEYIVENFGVFIDTERFVVHYSLFAENIFPDIRVFKLVGE